MNAAAEWDAMVKPWRAVAERRGFRLLNRQVNLIQGGHRCLDYLASGPTFLDLYGELGAVNGFWHATLTTWIDTPDARFSLTTIGEADPPPRKGIFAKLLVKVMHKLAGPSAPVPMKTPEGLNAAVDKHLGELLAIGGKPVLFDGLDARFGQATRDERS